MTNPIDIPVKPRKPSPVGTVIEAGRPERRPYVPHPIFPVTPEEQERRHRVLAQLEEERKKKIRKDMVDRIKQYTLEREHDKTGTMFFLDLLRLPEKATQRKYLVFAWFFSGISDKQF